MGCFSLSREGFFPTICDGLSPAAICLAKLEKAIFFNDLLYHFCAFNATFLPINNAFFYGYVQTIAYNRVSGAFRSPLQASGAFIL